VETKRASNLFTEPAHFPVRFRHRPCHAARGPGHGEDQEATLANADVQTRLLQDSVAGGWRGNSRAVDVARPFASSFSTPTLFQIANDLTKMQLTPASPRRNIGAIAETQAVDF